jgi:hypothetical protein
VKISHRHLMMATALCTGLVVAAPLSIGLAYAGPGTSASDPGFTPDTGQINPGFDKKNPTSSEPRKIPTPAEARAAKMKPYPTEPSVGEQQSAEIPATDAMSKETKDGQATAGGPQATNAGTDAMKNGSQDGSGKQPQPATVGAASRDAAGGQAQATQAQSQAQPPRTQPQDFHGPIGSTGQTMPSTLSERNDVLDRVPIMAQPIPMTDQERQRIYQAVMADKTQASAGAEALGPASFLSTEQALNETHPLPASVQDIAAVKHLQYVKTKDKVLLVEPATRIVFEQIAS